MSSYDWFGSFAFYPLGLAIWGPVASLVGIHTALWVAFGLFLVAILALVSLPAVRALRWEQPPVEEGTDATPPEGGRSSS